MERYGYPFAPEVALLYNPSGTAINRGEAVKWQGRDVTSVYSMKWPEPDDSAGQRPEISGQSSRTVGTRGVPGVVKASSRVLYGDICGIAMEDIPASSWGHVCMSGVTDAKLKASVTVTAGQALTVTSGAVFAGLSAANAATATVIHAMALEACTAGTSGGYVSVFIPPRAGPLDTLNFSTATG